MMKFVSLPGVPVDPPGDLLFLQLHPAVGPQQRKTVTPKTLAKGREGHGGCQPRSTGKRKTEVSCRLCGGEAPAQPASVFKAGTRPQLIFGWAHRHASHLAEVLGRSPSRDKGLLAGHLGRGAAGPRAHLVSGGVLQRERFRAGCGGPAWRPSVSSTQDSWLIQARQINTGPRSLGHVQALLTAEGVKAGQSPLGLATSELALLGSHPGRQ